MNQVDDMQVFVRVAELASFTAAAEQLGLAKASASGAVQRLENLVGTRLLHRTTRRVQLTPDGQVFYDRCKDLLADLDDVQTLFHTGPSGLRGRLRVDMPLAVARDVVLPRLPAFVAQHPGLVLELSSTDRRVDVVREGFDCVLRVGTLSDSSLIARPLGHYRMVNCASPAYLADKGLPQSLDDLGHHRLIHYVATLGAHSSGFEYLDTTSGQTHRLAMAEGLTVNNSDAYLCACLAGLGIVQVPEPGVRELLQTGQLVEVLPAWRPAPMPVTLLYPHRRHLPRRVQAFMQWLTEVMQPRLDARA